MLSELFSRIGMLRDYGLSFIVVVVGCTHKIYNNQVALGLPREGLGEGGYLEQLQTSSTVKLQCFCSERNAGPMS